MKFCEFLEGGNLEDTNSFTWSYKKIFLKSQISDDDDDCGGGGGGESLLYSIFYKKIMSNYVRACNVHQSISFQS